MPFLDKTVDAYRCFMGTEMDYHLMKDLLFEKNKQPKYADKDYWQGTYELD